MKRLFIVLLAGLALTACAKRPSAIMPISIPMAAYSGYTCKELAVEFLNEQAMLAAISREQSQAATGDAVGVLFLGVPVSSTFGGDRAGDVGVSKGKLIAIDSAMKSQRCQTAPDAVINTSRQRTPKATKHTKVD